MSWCTIGYYSSFNTRYNPQEAFSCQLGKLRGITGGLQGSQQFRRIPHDQALVRR
jgi:hypothetical protein